MSRGLALFCLSAIATAAQAQESVPAYIQSPAFSTSNFAVEGGEIPAWVIPRSTRFIGAIPTDPKQTTAKSPPPPVIAQPSPAPTVPAAVPPQAFFAPSSLSALSLDASRARTSQQWGELIRNMRSNADDLQQQATDAISSAERQRKLAIVKEQLNAIAELERAQKALEATQKQMGEILQPASPIGPLRVPSRSQAYPAEAIEPPKPHPQVQPPPPTKAGDTTQAMEIGKLRSELDELKKARLAADAQTLVDRIKQARALADADEQSRQRELKLYKSQLSELQSTEAATKTRLQQSLGTLQETQAMVARELNQGAAAARTLSEARKSQERTQQLQREEAVKAAAELQRLDVLKQAAIKDLESQSAKRELADKAAKERDAALEAQSAKLMQAQAGLKRIQTERDAVAAQVADEAKRLDAEKRLANEQTENARMAKLSLEKIQKDAATAAKVLAQNEAKTRELTEQQEKIIAITEAAKSAQRAAAPPSTLSSLPAPASASAGLAIAAVAKTSQATDQASGFVMLPQDRLVAATLARWAAQDNYSLFWSAPDVPTPHQEWALVGANTPQEAIDMTIAALVTSGIRLKLCEHTNRTLSVIKPDESCIQKQ